MNNDNRVKKKLNFKGQLNFVKKKLNFIVLCVIILFTGMISFAISEDNNCITNCTSPRDIRQTIENATSSIAYKYGVKDDNGKSMDTLKIIDNPIGGYLGVYHTGTIVKLATSVDLLNWKYKTDLESSASQPTIYALSNGGFLVAFEKHDNGGSVKINYYISLETLYSGTIRESFTAARSIGKVNEGTPNIYNVTLSPDIDRSVIDIGFHYQSTKNDQCGEGPDRQARGTLINFNQWYTKKDIDVDNAIIPLITDCRNIGDRDSIVYDGRSYAIYEADGGPATANFDKWRLFLYNNSSKMAVKLDMKTPKGGVVFANPTFSIVRNPKYAGKQGSNINNVLVVTLFVPSHNGKDPAGTYVYYGDIEVLIDRTR